MSSKKVKEDPDVKKLQNKHKFFNLDVLKSKQLELPDQPKKGLSKSMTQTTLEYFFKHATGKSNHVYANTNQNSQTLKKKNLQKQNSIGSYPIRIEITSEDDENNSKSNEGAFKFEAPRDADALALERPRKKLSFKIPEITGGGNKENKNKSGSYSCISKLIVAPQNMPGLSRNQSFSGILHKGPSCEDCELESQAMRVVRTIGQAFEVCHKLSINAPPDTETVQDDQETFTQDLLSDRLSDITSDKPKRVSDLTSEAASDRASLPPDDDHLEITPKSPSQMKKTQLIAETYSAPHSEALTTNSSCSIPPISSVGQVLSTHHELQLLHEQLEQQQQQTREAVAQLQLVREQLAAEQSARLEAQARTHQLLVHNRELLDHIAALVAHLQGGDKGGQQPGAPHMTMPQTHLLSGATAAEADHQQQDFLLQTLGFNPHSLIENINAVPPTSPLRTNFNPGGGIFNFNYPPSLETPPLDLMSRFYQPYHPMFGYNQSMGYLGNLYNQWGPNNPYNLQPPPQKKVATMGLRNSYPGSDVRISPGRNNEPRTPQYQTHPIFQYGSLNYPQNYFQNTESKQENTKQPEAILKNEKQRETNEKFIKPLPQMGALTTTDQDGRLRVIVPVPANGNVSDQDNNERLLANLKLGSDSLKPGAMITRSTSEKVPNRSELMSQVQRTTWARHTTN